MVTITELLRLVWYRVQAIYFRVVRRMLRGDRLLRRSERRFAALLESAPDAMVIVNGHGHIVLVNAEAERVFGYHRSDLVGRSVAELIPDRYRDQHHLNVRGFLRDPSRRPMGTGLELYGRRSDGSEFPVEISLSPLETEEGRLVSSTIRDVTERARATAELAAAEALFRGAFDGSPMGMALLDQRGRLARVNEALCDITGYATEHLNGATLDMLIHPDHLGTESVAIEQLLRGEQAMHRTETRFVHPAGHSLWVAAQLTRITGPPDEPRRVLLQAQDISYRKRYEENLEFLATHDSLTGLLNRAAFSRQLESHAELVRRYEVDGAVLLLDLDHFKYVNDTLGHHAGDQLIARAATILQSRLRVSDILARIGGDEFAALLPKADAAAAQQVATDLLDALRNERITIPGTRERVITASIGIAVFESEPDATGEDVLVNADLAMYDAKEAGRNQYAIYRTDEYAQARMKGRITWAERIQLAIETENFAFLAQPIVDLRTGESTQFEVLLRMLSDTGEIIPPGAFLYIAERLGMIKQIDMLTVAASLRALSAPEAAGYRGRIEVNLSGASIGDASLLELIERELQETGLDPGRVIFEITETAAIANIGRAREFSDRLKTLGCRFALDDFGAGFGSFYYLKHIGFDYLKIDGEFVRDLRVNTTDRLLVEAVVGIARGMGKATVAEHVGDQETVELLTAMGVDYGQGFHLHMPVPLKDYLRSSMPKLNGHPVPRPNL